ncbi:MAG TPA: sugar transferase [Rhizomicrobium sp.]|jgi:lipopolysaccharide/colanic/teichoic acid biosynthesis glycosyltransferase|nr:sugar transferase [Rhizomicrobium sp.]
MNAYESGKFHRTDPVYLYAPAANNNHKLSDDSPMIVGGSRLFWFGKRIVDLALSVIGLPVLLIAGAIIWALNPWFNPGPLLYTQVRIGLNGQLFWIWKFRSVVSNQDSDADNGSLTSDLLITRFGATLRRYRIDELPQLINVLRGEMSLIGPRPETIENIERFTRLLPGFSQRHLVRPGLSGLSQVTIGYTSCQLTYAQKLQYDREYIHYAGWRMEAHVFFKTIWVICTGFGAR